MSPYTVGGAHLREREEPRAVLRAGKMIAAHGRGLGGIGALRQIGVNEGRIPPPVFRRGIGEHDFWPPPPRLEACQEGAGLSADRIGLLGVGKGKELRDDVAHVLRRLAKAEIEFAPHAACDMRDHPV